MRGFRKYITLPIYIYYEEETAVLGCKKNLNETFNNGGKTGLNIYSDHITDIGAKVLNPPVPVHAPTLS